MGVNPGDLGGALVKDEDAVDDDQTADKVTGRSPTQIAFERLRKDKVAVVCTAIILLLLVLALLAGVITKSLDIYWDISDKNAPTQSEVLSFDGYPKEGPPYNGFDPDHPLGVAPTVGYDNLAYLLYGLRTSLEVAVAATVLSTILGVVIGLVAGFSRGWLDRILGFITDLFLSFPFLLGMLAIAPILVSNYKGDVGGLGRAQFTALIVILVVFGWMGLARLIRGQVLSLREREFIQAAEVIGVPTRRILGRELLPNMVAPIVVAVSLGLPGFVAAEAGLSFLGLGLTGRPSLGKMVADATPYYADYALYLWMPVGTIAILTLALNLLGDSVRDAFDPRTRR